MYLNEKCLANVDPELFRSCRPYPWLSLCGFLTDEGFHRLVESLPDITLFERQYGQQRAYGQASHDRYALQYRSCLEIAQPWKDFVSELQSEAYWSFLRKLFATLGEAIAARLSLALCHTCGQAAYANRTHHD